MTYHQLDRATRDFTETDAIRLVGISLHITHNRTHQQTISEQAYHHHRHPWITRAIRKGRRRRP